MALAQTRREVGPLASRLPRRHLTGHGEVWGDQGSPQLFLASVCSELDWRLAEQTKQQLIFFSFLLGCHFGGVSVCVWGGAGCVIKEEYHVSLSPRGGRLFLARKWDFTHNSHSVAWLKAIGKHPGVRVAF